MYDQIILSGQLSQLCQSQKTKELLKVLCEIKLYLN